MKKIPITIPSLGKEEAQAAYDTILSGWVTQGPRVEEFEKAFAEYVGTKYAVAVSSCTTALHLSLEVAGVKAGDEVICPSMSFVATANSIRYVGADPVFAEVGPDFNLDPDDAERKITDKTKAILLVHQIGMPANIDRFQALCDQHNLVLIEDGACAIGSSYNGKMIGSHSDLCNFSFHPRKVITTGDGGMITTNREDYYERMKSLRHHGMSVSDRVRHQAKKVVFEDYMEVGYNYRLTDIQASVGIIQLQRLPEIVEKRREIAYRYNAAFGALKSVIIPQELEGTTSNFQSYALLMTPETPISRDDLMQALLDQGISTRRGIMSAHRTKAYRDLYGTISLTETERLEDQSFLLPLYDRMTEEEIEMVIEQTTSLLEKGLPS